MSELTSQELVAELIRRLGEDPEREGLRATPQRYIKAWEEWTSGYAKGPQDILRVFEDGAEDYDEMVVTKDIPFYSHCEHHLAPFFGTVTIAYLPQGSIVGLSKLNRLVDVYARRLQVQERLTVQIADAIDTYLNPKGVGVSVKARHFCIESRGITQTGSSTVTMALRGCLTMEGKYREEFMGIAR